MGTKSGSNFFLDPSINKELGKIFSVWAEYLDSEPLTYVLSDSPDGWLCEAAQKAMLITAEGISKLPFHEVFECDETLPHHGFKSWDAFLTRQFKKGLRPIAAPKDHSIITNACESAPYSIATGAKETDRFWIKSQKYSLKHMLADDSLAAHFVGGTVYQAFLSAESYHRWHSPVDGKILQARKQPGTYFSKVQAGTFDPSDPQDPQAYITAAATRAVIVIEADNVDIGLLGVIPVGWAEVSTCEVIVHEGQHVKKGDLLGMFYFGGSTHCLLFEPGLDVVFDTRSQTPGADTKNISVNSKIATVHKRH